MIHGNKIKKLKEMCEARDVLYSYEIKSLFDFDKDDRTCKQVAFKDTENNTFHGGILLPNGDILCGCCGGIIPEDEQTEEYGFRLLKVYDDWINLDDEITGG